MADPNFQRLPSETKDRFRKMIEMDRREKEEKTIKKRQKEMEKKAKKAAERAKREAKRKKIADILYGSK